MTFTIIDPHIATNLAASAGTLAVLVPLRAGMLRRAKTRGTADGEAAIGQARIRTVFALLIATALGAVWFAEIQSFVWSITAVIMALTIATKELIQCGTGALMRAAGRSFRIDDRLEIDGIYGRIVAHGVLTTTIAEMERASSGRHETGRRIVLPNSRLFAADVRIDTRETRLLAHRFHVIFDPSVSAHAAVAVLEASLSRWCEPFADEVAAAASGPRSRGAAEVHPRPLVTLGTTDLARIRLDVLCTVPAAEAVALEREVKMEFLEWLWADAQARQLKDAPAPARLRAA